VRKERFRVLIDNLIFMVRRNGKTNMSHEIGLFSTSCSASSTLSRIIWPRSANDSQKGLHGFSGESRHALIRTINGILDYSKIEPDRASAFGAGVGLRRSGYNFAAT
jgi:hypothetical protein